MQLKYPQRKIICEINASDILKLLFSRAVCVAGKRIISFTLFTSLGDSSLCPGRHTELITYVLTCWFSSVRCNTRDLKNQAFRKKYRSRTINMQFVWLFFSLFVIHYFRVQYIYMCVQSSTGIQKSPNSSEVLLSGNTSFTLDISK